LKNRLLLPAALAFFLLASCGDGHHASVSTDSDPSGTWKWTLKVGDRSRDVSLKLAWDGQNLTGSLPGRSNLAVPITNAGFKNNTVSFSVIRESHGKTYETKYSAALSKDVLVGKSESTRDGQVQSREWKAERVKEEKK